MSKQLEQHEAEAVIALRGSNQKAWNMLMSYFDRRYELARDKCVVTRNDVQLEQGRAQAFAEVSGIEQSADEVLDAIKNR